MPRTPARVAALPLVALAVAALAGCGGSSHPSTTTTTAAAAAPATTGSTSTTGAVSAGLAGLASTANCSKLANLETAFEAALTGAGGNATKTAQVLQEFAAKTPPAIRPDFETVAQAFSKLAGEMKGVSLTSGGTINPAALAKLEKLGSQLKSTQLLHAESAISQWAAANCKK